MAYIGKIPAAAAVTASDLDPSVITGQTALGATPADTDEFIISDAGTLKRMDYSHIKGGGMDLVYSTDSVSTSVFNIDNVFTSSYKIYKVFLLNLIPNTDSEVQFNFRTGGSSGAISNQSNYRSTGIRQERYSAGGGSVAQANDYWDQSYARLSQIMENSNDAYAHNAQITIWDPYANNVTWYRALSSNMEADGNYMVGYDNNGVYNYDAIITGIAINTSAGAWSSGSVRIFGIKDS